MKFSIKELRVRFNLTQLQAAKEFEVSVELWRKWEHNPGKMPMRMAARVSERFGVTIDEILI